LFCSTCGAVQPPGDCDHFVRLGMARGYPIDAADLDRQYFGFQRRLHPDRFATRSAKERALSQQQAMALNDAYEILKDPLKCAIYLLALADRESRTGQPPADDQLVLAEAMEMCEELADAHGADQASQLAAEAEIRLSDCRRGLADAFAVNDLETARRLTARMTYLDRLAAEARRLESRMTR
jgi:molecular chaperone HscB